MWEPGRQSRKHPRPKNDSNPDLFQSIIAIKLECHWPMIADQSYIKIGWHWPMRGLYCWPLSGGPRSRRWSRPCASGSLSPHGSGPPPAAGHNSWHSQPPDQQRSPRPDLPSTRIWSKNIESNEDQWELQGTSFTFTNVKLNEMWKCNILT